MCNIRRAFLSGDRSCFSFKLADDELKYFFIFQRNKVWNFDAKCLLRRHFAQNTKSFLLAEWEKMSVCHMLSFPNLCYHLRFLNFFFHISDGPEWIEVITELLLSMVFKGTALSRNVAKLVLTALADHMTPQAFQLIVKVSYFIIWRHCHKNLMTTRYITLWWEQVMWGRCPCQPCIFCWTTDNFKGSKIQFKMVIW